MKTNAGIDLGPVIGKGNQKGDLRVRIWRSRCSSLVNDCPQYVQKTMLGYLPLKRVGQLGIHRHDDVVVVVVVVIVVCQM